MLGEIGLLAGVNVWDIVKTLVIAGMVIYLVFAFVVVRQVQLMIGTLDGSLTPVLKLVSWLHLLAAIAALLISVVLL